MRRIAISCFLVAVCVAASGASASDLRQCDGARVEVDVRIAACARLIASGRFKGKQLAKAFAIRGRGYFDRRDFDRAIADLDEAIRLDGRLVVALFTRGTVYRDKLDYPRALADASAAIRIDPRSAESLALRGALHRDMRDYRQAIADYSEAIRLKPKIAWIVQHRSAAYLLAGDRSRALADLEQALRIDSKEEAVHWGRGLYHYLTQDPDRAIVGYEESLRLKPRHNSDALYGRGLAKLLKGDTPGGNVDIAAARAIEPGITDLWMRKFGIAPGAALRQGQAGAPKDSEAVAAAAGAEPECSDAALHWKASDEIKSLAIYEDHLKRFPDCSFAALARARIEALRK